MNVSEIRVGWCYRGKNPAVVREVVGVVRGAACNRVDFFEHDPSLNGGTGPLNATTRRPNILQWRTLKSFAEWCVSEAADSTERLSLEPPPAPPVVETGLESAFAMLSEAMDSFHSAGQKMNAGFLALRRALEAQR